MASLHPTDSPRRPTTRRLRIAGGIVIAVILLAIGYLALSAHGDNDAVSKKRARTVRADAPAGARRLVS